MANWSQALITFTKSSSYSDFGFNKLAEIQQQNLILWADKNKILGTKDTRIFKLAIPHIQLIWIADYGHVPNLEQPQVTAQYILKFSSTEYHYSILN
ncbi:hypothetical protein CLI64_09150 [Nostoc sp. CENA543]|nr:hypothetical protein CLI64_09150 [Nostoc sp. CENA543]